MISADKILKSMRLTEKASKLSANYGQYTFEVYPSATKYTVREAVEQYASAGLKRFTEATITDPRALRAVAHPIRLELIGLLLHARIAAGDP